VTGALAGKAVIVTGAGAGLGRAYALAAASAGAAVVVNDIDASAAEAVVTEAREVGGRAVAVVSSVTDPNTGTLLVQRCVSEFGRLDGLVNNAGVLVEAPAWEHNDRDVTTMVAVNVLGTVYCGQAVIAHLVESGGAGSIVNVTSGTHLGQAGLAVYGATKGAVASLTYGWTLDLVGTAVRVNALSPLAVTAMKLPPYDGHAQPEDVAAVVVYLLSDSSSHLRGQIVRRARDELGVIKHPAIGTMLKGDWGVGEIAQVFEGDLAGSLEPTGFGPRTLAPGHAWTEGHA
jgi:NAD(P)-dependent dehydrogenase (short-subunit alcohol dehydrogenase family)